MDSEMDARCAKSRASLDSPRICVFQGVGKKRKRAIDDGKVKRARALKREREREKKILARARVLERKKGSVPTFEISRAKPTFLSLYSFNFF